MLMLHSFSLSVSPGYRCGLVCIIFIASCVSPTLIQTGLKTPNKELVTSTVVVSTIIIPPILTSIMIPRETIASLPWQKKLGVLIAPFVVPIGTVIIDFGLDFLLKKRKTQVKKTKR